ncbi:hypothetical protein [Marinobacterium aestuariivivens]|uniref:Cyclic nucleotide-binding domain-containing protein n=1 Tax=Marinobacterium aestuariivivens TaxID=1698799 RepID=A0ABW2A5M1_9GAMM
MKTISMPQLLQRYPPEYFGTLSTFGAITEETVRGLLEGGRILQLSEGDILYRSGSRVQEFFVLCAGKIVLYRNYDSLPVAVRTFSPGSRLALPG